MRLHVLINYDCYLSEPHHIPPDHRSPAPRGGRQRVRLHAKNAFSPGLRVIEARAWCLQLVSVHCCLRVHHEGQRPSLCGRLCAWQSFSWSKCVLDSAVNCVTSLLEDSQRQCLPTRDVVENCDILFLKLMKNSVNTGRNEEVAPCLTPVGVCRD